MRISSLVGLSDVAGIDRALVLYLSYNQLTELRKEAFTRLPNLQVLLLNHNQLTAIEAETFAGLDNLRELHLSHNRLTELRKGTFARLPNLQVLYLNHNQLTAIEAETFAELPPLMRELYLNGNSRLTPDNLRALREHLPNIQIQADDQAPSLLQRLNPFAW